jgi:hypothetical protein
MKKICVLMIKFYRKYISPLKKHGVCKYYPTCSQYALEAYERGWGLPDPDEVRHTINNNDVENAKQLINRFELIHPHNVKPE